MDSNNKPIGEPFAVHPERWAKYELDSSRLARHKQAQSWFDLGELSRDKIWEHLTPSLAWQSVDWRREQLGDQVVDIVSRKHSKLCDNPVTGAVNRESFLAGFPGIIPRGDVAAAVAPLLVPAALDAIFELVAWHAAFPFSISPEHPVDEDGLLRAVSILSLGGGPDGGLTFDPLEPSDYYGYGPAPWGPHEEGTIVNERHIHWELEYGRRLFRALAVPAPKPSSFTSATADLTLQDATPAATVTRLPVVRFIIDGDPQTYVYHDEDERTTDMLDAIAALPAGRDIPGTTKPFRESFEVVLGQGDLVIHEHDLSELVLPRSKLVALLAILVAFGPVATPPPPPDDDGGRQFDFAASSSSLAAWAADLELKSEGTATVDADLSAVATAGGGGGEDAGLTWDEFAASYEKHQVAVRTLMPAFFALFLAGPEDETHWDDRESVSRDDEPSTENKIR